MPERPEAKALRRLYMATPTRLYFYCQLDRGNNFNPRIEKMPAIGKWSVVSRGSIEDGKSVRTVYMSHALVIPTDSIDSAKPHR